MSFEVTPSAIREQRICEAEASIKKNLEEVTRLIAEGADVEAALKTYTDSIDLYNDLQAGFAYEDCLATDNPMLALAEKLDAPIAKGRKSTKGGTVEYFVEYSTKDGDPITKRLEILELAALGKKAGIEVIDPKFRTEAITLNAMVVCASCKDVAGNFVGKNAAKFNGLMAEYMKAQGKWSLLSDAEKNVTPEPLSISAIKRQMEVVFKAAHIDFKPRSKDAHYVKLAASKFNAVNARGGLKMAPMSEMLAILLTCFHYRVKNMYPEVDA